MSRGEREAHRDAFDPGLGSRVAPAPLRRRREDWQIPMKRCDLTSFNSVLRFVLHYKLPPWRRQNGRA
eukprot:625802-Pleurochrysis_carterae.AAC.2